MSQEERNQQDAPEAAAQTDATSAPPPERFFTVRKLAALDLVFHGPRFILIEFGVGVLVPLALGALALWSGRSQSHAPFTGAGLLGLYLVSLACNYLPLLLYAIALVRRGDAAAVVAYELAHRELVMQRYSIQQALLLVPFFVLGLALWQEWRARQGSAAHAR